MIPEKTGTRNEEETKMMKKMTAGLLILALILSSLAGLAEQIWQKGDTGERVTEIQARLQELGYLEEDPTGTFDELTEKALMDFQRDNGLLATGMAELNAMKAPTDSFVLPFTMSR